MKTLITIVLIVVIALFFVRFLDAGIKKHERAECLRWQQESQQYEGWYSSSWQREQCKQFDIGL